MTSKQKFIYLYGESRYYQLMQVIDKRLDDYWNDAQIARALRMPRLSVMRWIIKFRLPDDTSEQM